MAIHPSFLVALHPLSMTLDAVPRDAHTPPLVAQPSPQPNANASTVGIAQPVISDRSPTISSRSRSYRRRFSIGDNVSESPSDSSRRPPPTAFPFQAYPGNPDPGMSIPGLPRRNPSVESMTLAVQRSYAALGLLDPILNPPHTNTLPRSGSLSDLHRPQAPFMSDHHPTPPSPTNSVYRNSAAANMSDSIPRVSSAPTVFRAPFLSPASRPTSSLWSPPSNHNLLNAVSPNESATALAASFVKSKAPLPSTRLTAPLSESEKPWIKESESRSRAAWWVTLACWCLGLVGAAILCWTGITDVKARMINQSSLCLVMDENWSGGLDPTRWTKDVELGGFGFVSNLLIQKSSTLTLCPGMASLK